MSDGPSFCVAVEADSTQLLLFMRDYYAFDGHGFDEGKARAALVALLRDSNLGRAWLILDDEIPVGYGVLCFGYSLEWLGRDAFVDELYLTENFRGRGWGAATMTFLENEARALGVRALHLGVVENNPAIHLYRKLGFKEHTSRFLSKWIERDASKPQGAHGY